MIEPLVELFRCLAHWVQALLQLWGGIDRAARGIGCEMTGG